MGCAGAAVAVDGWDGVSIVAAVDVAIDDIEGLVCCSAAGSGVSSSVRVAVIR
jgi:hypothetical protein